MTARVPSRVPQDTYKETDFVQSYLVKRGYQNYEKNNAQRSNFPQWECCKFRTRSSRFLPECNDKLAKMLSTSFPYASNIYPHHFKPGEYQYYEETTEILTKTSNNRKTTLAMWLAVARESTAGARNVPLHFVFFFCLSMFVYAPGFLTVSLLASSFYYGSEIRSALLSLEQVGQLKGHFLFSFSMFMRFYMSPSLGFYFQCCVDWEAISEVLV